ncbi:MAG: hypothetical protein QNJ60_00240 [Xenococcaceae cyanobacterium MO_188.B19]|nr:hypothetical protein [Xenococcaceae cyanobacterium MO_188.B19]
MKKQLRINYLKTRKSFSKLGFNNKQLKSKHFKASKTSKIKSAIKANQWFIKKQILALIALVLTTPIIIKFTYSYSSQSRFFTELSLAENGMVKIFIILLFIFVEFIVYIFFSEFFMNEEYNLKGVWMVFDKFWAIFLGISLLLTIGSIQ